MQYIIWRLPKPCNSGKITHQIIITYHHYCCKRTLLTFTIQCFNLWSGPNIYIFFKTGFAGPAVVLEKHRYAELTPKNCRSHRRGIFFPTPPGSPFSNQVCSSLLEGGPPLPDLFF